MTRLTNYWNNFTNVAGQTVFHPQYIINRTKETLLDNLRKYAKGDVLDIGSGRKKYRNFIVSLDCSYTSLDHPHISKLYPSFTSADIMADAHKLPLKNNSYETVLLINVLEYLSNPQEAFKEISRVLKKNGILILASPFIYPIHDYPYDHNRFTDVQLKLLVEDADLKVIHLIPQGGFWDSWLQAFLMFYFKNIISLINSKSSKLIFGYLLLSLSPIVTILTNLVYLIFADLINKLDASKDFPLSYIVIAKKK